MSENTAPYAPGVYVKGDVERVAQSASAAVALVFDGFKPKASAPVVADEPKVTETPTPTPSPSPRELAQRNKSQEDDKS